MSAAFSETSSLEPTPSPSPRIWINLQGDLQPAEQARISALDHGFLYGDSVYETVRTWRGVPFLLDSHLDRLGRSMAGIHLDWPAPRAGIEEEVLRTIREAPWSVDSMLRIVVTRGAGPLGLDISRCREPRFLIYVVEILEGMIPRAADPDGSDPGVDVVISQVRRNHPDALDPSIKSGNFLNNILAFRDARAAGAYEAILLDSQGFIAEGTTSNVFCVRDGAILTPRAAGILEGITRAVVLEEARAAGFEPHEEDLRPEDLAGAQEAFLTSSVRGVVPIARVDGRRVGGGAQPGGRGPVTRELQHRYRARMDRECGFATDSPESRGSR